MPGCGWGSAAHVVGDGGVPVVPSAGRGAHQPGAGRPAGAHPGVAPRILEGGAVTVAGPFEAAHPDAPHAAVRDRACVEPGARPVHGVRLGVGTVLRAGGDVAGDARRGGSPAVPGLRRLPSPPGWRGVRVVCGHWVAAVTDPDRARLRRRRALQRGKPLARRTPLRSGGELRRTGRVYSERRLAELPAEWDARQKAVAAAAERDGWACQARPLVPAVPCDGPLEGHEPLMRSRGGDPLDVDQIVTTCAAHHRWAHANPTAAGELGLLRHSWEGPIER